MRTITLDLHGTFCMVDDDDYDWLIKYRWHLYDYKGMKYAKRTAIVRGRKTTVYMHREIAKKFIAGRTRKRNLVDHDNTNGLDNRRENLWWATPRENRLSAQGCRWRHMTDFPEAPYP